jgi:hypothetical protein
LLLQSYTYQIDITQTTNNMDDDMQDLVMFACVMLLFLSFPIIIVLSITGSIAYSRTKAWDKTRNQGAVSLESTRLVDTPSDESDFVDTDDEDEHNKRKAEEESDKSLTFNQKFRKEFKKCWSGKGREEVVKIKEREERRKLAKAVAREMDRRERRRARQAAKGQAEELPPYVKN